MLACSGSLPQGLRRRQPHSERVSPSVDKRDHRRGERDRRRAVLDLTDDESEKGIDLASGTNRREYGAYARCGGASIALKARGGHIRVYRTVPILSAYDLMIIEKEPA